MTDQQLHEIIRQLPGGFYIAKDNKKAWIATEPGLMVTLDNPHNQKTAMEFRIIVENLKSML